MSTFFKIIGVLIGIMFTLNLSLFAQKGMGDSNGVARPAIQPTIIEVEGSLDHIKTGPCEHTTGYAIIGTHLFIETNENDQLVNVHLGAAYAVESFVSELEIGQKLRFQAFRTDNMGPMDLIAKEIVANGETQQLLDDNLRPVWAGDQHLMKNRHFGRNGYYR